jgi:hypothetical protein
MSDTSSISGQWFAQLKMNGTEIFNGGAGQEAETAGGEVISFVSPVITVIAGDFFEVDTFSTSTRTTDADGRTYFAIEAVEQSAVSAVTSSSNSIPLGADFLMTGELAGSDGQTTDGTVTADTVKLDFIYFPDTTTISEVSVRSATASGGGTLIVGLHPLTARLEMTTQDFIASITVSTSASTQHTEVLSTAWVVPKGWYALVTWSGASLSNIIHRAATTGSGIGFGKFISGAAQIYNTTAQEAETKTIFLSKTDYDVSPDLTGVVFNNIALYVNSPTAGQLSISSRVPMVYLKVV